MTVDTRTGRIILRDTGDLAAAGRGPHFNWFSNVINDNPQELGGMLARLRFSVRLKPSTLQIYSSIRLDNRGHSGAKGQLPRPSKFSDKEFQ